MTTKLRKDPKMNLKLKSTAFLLMSAKEKFDLYIQKRNYNNPRDVDYSLDMIDMYFEENYDELLEESENAIATANESENALSYWRDSDDI